MLILRKGRPEAQAVPLNGGAVIFVRPATSFEVDLAAAGAAQVLAGLVESQEAAAEAVAVLGEEFSGADFSKKHWLEAAAQRIALLELATLCVESWSGIGLGKNQPIEKPDRVYLALLLRDSDCARRIGEAIKARVHDEVAEGNGLAVSPAGGVKAADPIAANAAAPEAPAPTASAAETATAAPK